LLRTHLLHDVIVGTGLPSVACSAELTKSVDGGIRLPWRPRGDGASTAALVLRQDLRLSSTTTWPSKSSVSRTTMKSASC